MKLSQCTNGTAPQLRDGRVGRRQPLQSASSFLMGLFSFIANPCGTTASTPDTLSFYIRKISDYLLILCFQ